MTKRVKWAIAFTLVTLLLASCGGQSTAEKPADPDPQLGLAYITRGAAYLNSGQYQRAVRDLDEAIRLGPPLGQA